VNHFQVKITLEPGEIDEFSTEFAVIFISGFIIHKGLCHLPLPTSMFEP